jgi:peptidoglycan/LPS O-acetylase OafA/YrhL
MAATADLQTTTPAPADALRPPPGNPRFPLLDSLRAIAAFSILVTHASGVSNFNADNALGAYTARLNFGVTIFFLLSGFLLYRPFVAARREGRPPVRIRDYVRRRALRIVPAYWVALTLLAVYPGLEGFGEHWWRFYTFTQIYWFDSILQGIGPAWTLCIEISFYVALPFIAAGLARLRPSPRAEIAILLGLAALCVAYRTVLQASGGYHVAQSTLLAYFDWFAYGMVLAVLSVAWHGREQGSRVLSTVVRRPWVPWAVAAFVFWLMATQFDLSRSFFIVYTDLNYFGEHAAYAACAALLLLPAIFGDWAGGWPRRVLAWRPLPWLGLISYGVFLYHAPIMLEVNDHDAQTWLPGSGFLSLVVATAAFAVPLAALSYYLAERPALKLKDRRARRAG